MKKCINAWAFPAELALDKMFALAKECRYDGVELNMAEAGPDHPINSLTTGNALALGMAENEWENIKRVSEQYNLPVTGISTSLHWKYPLTDDNAEIREKGMYIVREMLNAAAYLGCDAILVVPGAVTEQVSYKSAYDRSIDAFKELSTHAENRRVTIGIENVWNKFLLSPLEMAAFIDEVNSKYIKAYFDAGNVLQFSYPEHWIEALGERIVKVHIKDFDCSIGNASGFKPLLQGDMRWDRLMNALRKVGYDDSITAELFPFRFNPSQLVRDTSEAMDYILSL